MPIDETPRRDRSDVAPMLPAIDVTGAVDIWPCTDCDAWHLVAERKHDRLILREWHAKDCPRLLRSLQ